MGYVSLSKSKMELKARKSELEQSLNRIRHEKEKLSSHSQNETRISNKLHNQDMTNLYIQHQKNRESIWDQYDVYGNKGQDGVEDYHNQVNTITDSSGNNLTFGSGFDKDKYNEALPYVNDEDIAYILNKQLKDDEYSDEQQYMEEEVARQETQLDLEQEQLQTELQEVNAQIESYTQAVSADIKAGVINFGA